MKKTAVILGALAALAAAPASAADITPERHTGYGGADDWANAWGDDYSQYDYHLVGGDGAPLVNVQFICSKTAGWGGQVDNIGILQSGDLASYQCSPVQ